MSGVPMMIPKWVLKKLGFTGTTAEVNAAISSGRIKEGDTVIITDDNNDTLTASQVSFDNTGTGMSATSAQGAIAELNNDLTDLQEEIDNMGMPNLDYSNPLHTFSANNLIYTANRECYLVGSYYGAANQLVKLNNHIIAFGSTSDSQGVACAVFINLKLNSGDTVVCPRVSEALHVYKEK